MVYSIGAVAMMLRVSTQSLRNWEKQELIPKPARRPTHIREYTEADVESIKQFLNTKNNK